MNTEEKFIVTDNKELAKESHHQVRLIDSFSADSVWEAMVDYVFSAPETVVFVSTDDAAETFAKLYGVQNYLINTGDTSPDI